MTTLTKTPDPNEDFCRKLCEKNVNPLTIKSRLWKLKNPEATREMSRRDSARIKIDSVALSAPMKWVNTRLFKVIGRKVKP